MYEGRLVKVFFKGCRFVVLSRVQKKIGSNLKFEISDLDIDIKITLYRCNIVKDELAMPNQS